MFTGLIRQIGTVQAVESLSAGKRIVISIDEDRHFIAGESISINGCCLTALENDTRFIAEVSQETLSLTNLKEVITGSQVNVEPALKAGDALGGHWVMGHIDGTGTVTRFQEQGDFHLLTVSHFNPEFNAFLIKKGSITVDGISLTVNNVGQNSFECTIIPHTLSNTNLINCKVGNAVNLEFDYLARIVAKQLEKQTQCDLSLEQ